MLNNKGQMRTIEAFLSILLLFSALALATLISPPTNLNTDNTLATIGMQALISIDIDGRLGRLIDKGNWTTVASALDTLLPTGISYNLSIYDEKLQPINNVSISNGVIRDRNVVSVQYPCVSQSSQGNFYILRLHLATAR